MGSGTSKQGRHPRTISSPITSAGGTTVRDSDIGPTSAPSSSFEPEMPRYCSDCTLKIGVFKKKHICSHCQDYFCDSCFSKSSALLPSQNAPSNPQNVPSKQCVPCNMRTMLVFRRDQLFPLSVKHLRHFLINKGIAVEECTEKYHLVDLIMQFAERNGQKSVSDIAREELREMEVEMMRQGEIRRQAEEETRREEEARDDAREVQRETEAPEEPNTSNAAPETPEETVTEEPPSDPQYKSSKHRFNSVDNFNSEEDIANLTVLQLKQILTVNFIDYRGCVEKKELIERVKRLWIEQKRKSQYEEDSHSTEKSYERDLCKICMDSMIDCVLLDCGHLVTCTKCGKRLAECPICRQLVVKVVHVFRA